MSPQRQLGGAQGARSPGVFPEDVVDVFEGLFKHGGYLQEAALWTFASSLTWHKRGSRAGRRSSYTDCPYCPSMVVWGVLRTFCMDQRHRPGELYAHSSALLQQVKLRASGRQFDGENPEPV